MNNFTSKKYLFVLKRPLGFLLRGFYICTLLLAVTNCSSPIRILDTWTADEFDHLKSRNILVVSKAQDTEYRKLLEEDITRRLHKRGLKAGESYLQLPSLEPPENEEEEQKIKEQIIASGYDGLVVASIKNIIKSLKPGTRHSIEDLEIPEESSLSTTYIIEANIYDLKRNNGEELVGVNLVGLTDPKTDAKLSKSYSKNISQQFKKGL